MARAYVRGDLELRGVHPGDPYEALRLLSGLRLRRPSASQALELVRGLGWERLRPPPPPPEEASPAWRRALDGLRHSRSRDARAVQHHYDVSNAFYERVLGPSMTYTCALFRDPGDHLDAQAAKHELVAGKLGLKPGMRLLDVGCGWGGMVRHAAREHGTRALGVTLSREQAAWAQAAIEREGLGHLAEVRHMDYRDAPLEAFDAISSIGLTEHIGVRSYGAYFGAPPPTGCVLAGGCSTTASLARTIGRRTGTPGRSSTGTSSPTASWPGPDGVISEVHDAGLEVQHEENLRAHYTTHARGPGARTSCYQLGRVRRGGGPSGVARVWGLYMAGSRWSFEQQRDPANPQVLATKTGNRWRHHVPVAAGLDALKRRYATRLRPAG